MITNGTNCLVVAAVDTGTLANVLAQAKAQQIPVIAYDRLLMDTDGVSCYVTFDNKRVGNLMGKYVENTLGLAEGKGPYNIEFFAGSPDDNNAHLVNEGAFEVLQPYLDKGQLVCPSGQTSFDSICTLRWSQEIAQRRMEDLIAGYYTDGKKLDAVGWEIWAWVSSRWSKSPRLWPRMWNFSSLNDEESNTLLELMLKLKGRGITCIMISHKLHEISRVADKVTVIRDGKTIETVSREHGAEIDEKHIINGMVGRDLTNIFPERHVGIGEKIFEVKDWTVFDEAEPSRKRINRVSFHVCRGEVVGFAGLMGAGRSELMMSIFGHSYGYNSSGHIYKDGREIRIADVKSAIDHKIAYVPEDRKTYGLVLIRNIRWNMTLASLAKCFSKKNVIQEEEEIHAADDYRSRLNIKSSSVNQLAENLSGGNQQKVVLAKWMQTEPDVLILDEPTRGIDVGAKYEIYTIINQLAEQGKAILVVSSEMPELLGLCDRLYVLNEGEIAGELPKEKMDQEVIMKIIMDHAAGRVREK